MPVFIPAGGQPAPGAGQNASAPGYSQNAPGNAGAVPGNATAPANAIPNVNRSGSTITANVTYSIGGTFVGRPIIQGGG
jgi:hypothetical protein